MLGYLIRSKGLSGILHSGRALLGIFGLTSGPMMRSLVAFSALVRRHGGRATFPVTASVLKRHAGRLSRAVGDAIQLSVHGYRHVDYSLMSPQGQAAEIARARRAFQEQGIPATGFRAPYLRWNDSLLAALHAAGFAYDSSESILWPVVAWEELASPQQEALQTLLDFYRPRAASQAPSLPRWVDGLPSPVEEGQGGSLPLLEVPVSLPDDEMLVERLGWRDAGRIAACWLAVAEMCHARGELFVLQLHPGRFALCANALARMLAWAADQRPPVWVASLGEVAGWWQEKRAAQVRAEAIGEGRWQVTVEAPQRAVLLARGPGVEGLGVEWLGVEWHGGYRLIAGRTCSLSAPCRPWVGLAPDSPETLAGFLRDQGYIVERGERPADYAAYFAWEPGHRPSPLADAAAALAQVERTPGPPVRLARWPDGAQSALAISGDIDALTIWDYSLRLVGR